VRRSFLVALVSLLGCTAAPPAVPSLSGDEVTLFVPGIKGSFLWTDGPEPERAWLSAGDVLSRGDRSLALPPGGTDRFGPLHPDGVLTRFTILPFVKEDVYLPWLEFGADHLTGFTPFAYDWRQDVRGTIEALGARIEDLARTRPGLRVNLIGHSLGGLIAFEYARLHPERLRRLVIVGSPFAGSWSFLRDLVEGDAVGRNTALLSADAMRSFPSAWQLLPPPGHLIASGASEEESLLASLIPDPDARDRLLAARRAFRADLARARALPPLLVVVGTGRPTLAGIVLRGTTPDWDASPRAPGDGRVTDGSAQPANAKFELLRTAADHVNLLNDETVQVEIRRFVR
jgi:pimeloyl-ACP methyl ester carboxylesterase